MSACRAAVRRSRCAALPRSPGPSYAGFTTRRVVVPAPEQPFAPHETRGRGALRGSPRQPLRGTQPLKDGRIHAYAAAVAPAGARAADDEKAELLRRFGAWHDPIPGIIAAVEPDQVLRNDVHHLIDPLPAFHRGRTVLVGDSAHAMTPSLGQGGNQAIEDAIVLAHHAAPDADLGTALAAYSADRLPRTGAIVRKAARVARLMCLTSAASVAVRDTLRSAVSRLGPALVLRTFDGIADWRPPQHTYAARAKDMHMTRR